MFDYRCLLLLHMDLHLNMQEYSPKQFSRALRLALLVFPFVYKENYLFIVTNDEHFLEKLFWS